jgi:hypothetical protein
MKKFILLIIFPAFICQVYSQNYDLIVKSNGDSIAMSNCKNNQTEKERNVWSKEHAYEWQAKTGWLCGANFIPSTAINQLEMWQAETFDTVTIDRELGWAESTGMNAMRVYLHHLAWQIDSAGFKQRMDKYLAIAEKHGIGSIFVFFDDCWNPTYQAGKQPDPKPGVHNSGWVRDPGDLLYQDTSVITVLEAYVKDIMKRFSQDKRILLWDLYNEPGNSGYGNKSLPLLEKIFTWGHTLNPSQPLSSAVWNIELTELNKFQLENSDVITYHDYKNDTLHRQTIDSLKLFGRPMICSEYMARQNNSRFENILPILNAENIGAINWGLVSGKTNTIYAWNTPIPDGSEPDLWFHDIFRKDGTPYIQEEVDLIKSLTSKN